MTDTVRVLDLWTERVVHQVMDGRVENIEDKYVISTRFTSVSSTTGTLTLPALSQVVLDDFGGTVDAVCSALSGGRPSYDPVYTAGASVVSTTFDSSGNYILSGTPTSFPVAIIYRVRQLLKDFDSTSSDIIGGSNYAVAGGGGGGTWGSIMGTLSDQTDLSTALNNKASLVAGVVPTSELGTGTPSSAKFLRGDGTWATPPSGGGGSGTGNGYFPSGW